MTAIRRPIRLFRLRNWRGLLAACLAISYLLSGVLHTCQCIDVTNPSGGSEIAAIVWSRFCGHSDHKALGGHHCHGCFSVAVAQPLQPDAMSEFVAASIRHAEPALVGIVARHRLSAPQTSDLN